MTSQHTPLTAMQISRRILDLSYRRTGLREYEEQVKSLIYQVTEEIIGEDGPGFDIEKGECELHGQYDDCNCQEESDLRAEQRKRRDELLHLLK